jgi:hypothetical protein
VLGAVGGFPFDICLERLSCPPVSRRRQTQSSDEAVDCVGHRSIWSELAEKCFLSRWEGLELQIKAGCQLVRGQTPALPEVVGDRIRQGIRRAAWKSGLIGKSAQRIADRHVYPGTAQLNRPAVKVNGVEPPADAVSCLQDDTLDFRLTQGVGNRQPSNARPYDHDPLYRLMILPGISALPPSNNPSGMLILICHAT